MIQKRILMARKPCTLKEVEDQVTGKITPAEIEEIVKNKEIKETEFESWIELQKADLASSQYWKVQLIKEDVILLIDTSGYDYPRYVGFLERRSDDVSLQEKVKDYKEHYFEMMNDLSKDDLIQQIWSSKPMADKIKEATEFSRNFDD